MSRIKIGTRGSALALYQARQAEEIFNAFFPSFSVEIVVIKTAGDLDQKGAIDSLGTGIFTREIEEALLKKEVDVAVHSAKDLESTLPRGLEIGAFLDREDTRDCLISKNKLKLKDLHKGARIGTASPRRISCMRQIRNDLVPCEIRGNVDTRLKKIERGEYDGMILALAGLKRLGLDHHAAEIFDREIFWPQPGQGAIAIQVRMDDIKTKEMLSQINHHTTAEAVKAERSFLKTLEGGCRIPLGIISEIKKDKIYLKGIVFSKTGSSLSDSIEGPVKDSEKLGETLARQLLSKGAAEILKEFRNEKA